FSLAGVTTFTMFDPVSTQTGGVCAQGGESRIFIINTANAAGYAIDPESQERTRFAIVPVLSTGVYAEPSGTKNQVPPGMGDPWTEEIQQIYSDLKKLYPPNARFSNRTINLRSIRSDTGIEFIAPVPVAIE